MIYVAPSQSLSVIPDEECRRLLATAEIGRVVVSVDALPAALPVNYRVINESIVFRTAPGSKLTAAVSNTVVGFEADDLDPANRSGWSVLVVGISQVVTDPIEIAELDEAGIRSWLAADLPYYVKIHMERISGRRLTRLVP